MNEVLDIKKFIKEHWHDHQPSVVWYDLVTKYAEGSKIALDIGTSAGFSACAIAKNGQKVITIDIKEERGLPKLVAEELGLLDKIEYIKTSSDDFFRDNPDMMFDYIVIDGCHDYSNVFRDLENSYKHLLEDNGRIICDDFERYTGTNSAIKDWIRLNKIDNWKVDTDRMVIWKGDIY